MMDNCKMYLWSSFCCSPMSRCSQGKRAVQGLRAVAIQSTLIQILHWLICEIKLNSCGGRCRAIKYKIQTKNVIAIHIPEI